MAVAIILGEGVKVPPLRTMNVFAETMFASNLGQLVIAGDLLENRGPVPLHKQFSSSHYAPGRRLITQPQ